MFGLPTNDRPHKSRSLLTQRNIVLVILLVISLISLVVYLHSKGHISIFRKSGVLDGVTSENVNTYPYPFFTLDNVVPKGMYTQLSREYPDTKTFAEKNFFKQAFTDNKRLSVSASSTLYDIDVDNKISLAWKEFIQQHTTPEFVMELIQIFAPFLKEYYPGRFDRFIDGQVVPKVGIRLHTDFQRDGLDFQIDAQICINTPVVEKPTSVRLTHLDSPDKLFTGLLYMRHQDDPSEGGDLEVYEWAKDGKGNAEDPRVKTFATVKYASNNLVFFMNTKNSLHGVTIRQQTGFVRRFVNFIVMVPPEPLFPLQLDEYHSKTGELIGSKKAGN